jgi:hypothetical protein
MAGPTSTDRIVLKTDDRSEPLRWFVGEFMNDEPLITDVVE